MKTQTDHVLNLNCKLMINTTSIYLPVCMYYACIGTSTWLT